MTDQSGVDYSEKSLGELKQELMGQVEQLDRDAVEYLIRMAQREMKWRNDLSQGTSRRRN